MNRHIVLANFILTFTLLTQSVSNADVLSRQLVKRDLIPSTGREQITGYEGQPVTINCTKSNKDSAGGEPQLVFVGSDGNQPDIVTTRPDLYTVEGTMTLDRRFNSPNSVQCKNGTYSREEVWDGLIYFTVYYLDIKPGRLSINNEVTVMNQQMSVDCRDWFDSNYDIEYFWSGNVVPDHQVLQSFVQFSPDQSTGTRTVRCNAQLKGDTAGFSSKSIEFTVKYSNNSAASTSANMLLIIMLMSVLAQMLC